MGDESQRAPDISGCLQEKQRCLFIVPSLTRGGAETQLVDLVNRFDNALFEKHLVVLEKNLDQLTKVDRKMVKLHHLPKKRKLDWQLVRRIANIIDDLHIDVIHGTIQYSIFIGWLARLLAKRKPRLIAAIHTTINVGIKDELYDRILYRPILRHCDHIIFVCKNQRDYWLNKYPELEPNSVVIYNGIDPDAFQRKENEEQGRTLLNDLKIPNDAFVITCIAGFRPEKGHAILLRAFAGLSKKARLLLAGDGPLKKDMVVLAKKLDVDTRIFFLGNLSDVRPVLAITHIMVLASTAVETFSIAMLEAMAMEVPVVASDIGGLSEAIIEGETGNLVQPGDAILLRDAMHKHIEHSGMRSMSASCRQTVATKFNVNQMVNQTSRICLAEVAGTK